jgi:cob(I)alamin adenosyltransferase
MENRTLTHFEPKEKVGLIVVITGHGKGKTTAAMGIALRAAGHNMKVCIIEFMKGDMYSGEIDGVKKLSPNVELHHTGPMPRRRSTLRGRKCFRETMTY